MDLDYEEDVEIDPDALDVEWLEQSSLAIKYAKYALHLQRKVKLLEEKKKTVKAELIREANEDPQKCCNKAKPNAADIEAYYRTSERYKQIVKKLIDAQFEADIADVAKNEVCFTRKAALENLVLLYGQQYFAGPKVPRNIGAEWENRKRDKQINKRIGMTMNKDKEVDGFNE